VTDDYTETGLVNGVSFTPGRRDGLLEFATWSGDPTDTQDRRGRMLLAAEPGARITVDGQPVDLKGLLAWLVDHANPRVILHPLSERYNAALQAEFTTEGT
jgi:hypothetical protein